MDRWLGNRKNFTKTVAATVAENGSSVSTNPPTALTALKDNVLQHCRADSAKNR
jgi:hypothetical protein